MSRIAGVFPRSSREQADDENAHNSSRNEQSLIPFTSKTVLSSDTTTTTTTLRLVCTSHLANRKNLRNRMKRTVATAAAELAFRSLKSPLLVVLAIVLNLFLISSGQLLPPPPPPHRHHHPQNHPHHHHQHSSHHSDSSLTSLSGIASPPKTLDEILQVELLQQQQQGMKKSQSKSQRQAPNSPASVSKSEYDKIKREVLIDAFKLKLLKLLDLDEAPSPAQVNISRDQIPEPIIKEYEKLLKQQNGGKSGRAGSRGAGFYRRSRDMPSKSMHHNEADSSPLPPVQDEENEIEEENIRFNGSIVQQLTLLPKKYSQLDRNENDGSWCSEIYDPMSQNLKPVPTLGCLMFNLEQKEFEMYYLKSADLYIKLDTDFMRQLISLIAEAAESQNLSDDPFDSTSINVKVNGRLVKQLDITREFARLNQQNRAGRSNGGDNSVFEYADIRSVIEDEIFKSGGSKISLKVKFLFKSELMNSMVMGADANSTALISKLTDLFADLDESVALHVKFGEKVNGGGAHSGSNHLRNRRQASSNGGGKKSGGGRGQARHYRDCADLRKIGFASSNYSCCREVITFSMDQIGWGHWILSPKIIEYKYCRGSCLAGVSPRFDNTQIVYKMFEMSHSFEAAHCCNIYDYEEDIPFIYGSPPNYLTKMVSLNAKNCLCS